MGERGAVNEIQEGEMITLDEFMQWIVDGKINGVHMDADIIFELIQSRIWICPVCKEAGYTHRISHSLEATIDVGNPICPEGHPMVLFNGEENDEQPI